MTKDRHTKESNRSHASKLPGERSGSHRYEMRAPGASRSAAPVADSSTQAWQKYCDARLRHFSGGR